MNAAKTIRRNCLLKRCDEPISLFGSGGVNAPALIGKEHDHRSLRGKDERESGKCKNEERQNGSPHGKGDKPLPPGKIDKGTSVREGKQSDEYQPE